MLCNLANQTRPPDETLVYVSGTIGVEQLQDIFPEVQFFDTDTHNDWGHKNRSDGLAAATSDYLGFFNDDDRYSLDYIEKMMGVAETGADVVYCNWSGVPDCVFALGSSTSGNYIARTSLAQQIGYPTDHRYEADGDLINAIAATTDHIVKTNEMLYTHNALIRRGNGS